MSITEEEEFQGDSSEEEFQEEAEEEEEEEALQAGNDDCDDSDDVPLAALKSSKKSKTQEESDSDDDIPLAALKSPPKKKKPAESKKAAPKKKKAEAKAPKPKKKMKKTETPTETSSNGSYRSTSAALYGTGCKKGMLIQRLLCRWWYVIKWPVNIPEQPPKHYDSLDGMPGVYICTSGSDVGRIQDMREKTNCPNFNNFARKSSDELKDLLLTALEAQKEALLQAEGSGTSTEKEIKDMIKWVEKVNPLAADKEAQKVLKAAKLTL